MARRMRPVPLSKPTKSRRSFFSIYGKALLNAGKAARVEATTYKPISRISRREAFRRGIIGTTGILASTELGRKRTKWLSGWVWDIRENEVTMGFGLHIAKRFVQDIAADIDVAAAEGRPYKLFFREAVGFPEQDLPKLVAEKAAEYTAIRASIKSLVSSGIDEKSAKSKVAQELLAINTQRTEFIVLPDSFAVF